MGRRKFRLSDMMPNAWFYKLRDMRARGRGRGGGGAMQPQPPSSSRGNRVVQKLATPTQGSSARPHRASYYYTTRDRELTPPPPPPQPRATDAHLFPLPLSPPKNSRRRHRLGPVRLEHAPAGSGLVPAPVSARRLEPVAETPCTSQRRHDMCVGYDGGEFRRLRVTVPVGDGLHGKVIASETDIIIDLRAEATPEKVLRPIATRPARRDVDRYEPENRHVELADMTPRASSASEQSGMGEPRGSSGRRLKTRANSLRMVAGKGRPTAPAAARTTRLRSSPFADSYAMVKPSEDPRSDFLESMAEMIAENGIFDPSELEDLLASYLSLNTVEYHGIIIDAFEQIRTSLASVKP